MNTKHNKHIILMAAALLCASATASAGAGYLPAGKPDVIALLAPPPAPGSAEDRADLEEACAVSSAAPDRLVARARDEDNLNVFHFAPAIGNWFQAGKLPKLEAFFKQVEKETKAVTSVGKTYWKRLRPYHVDPARFNRAIEDEYYTDYSYPSGHSTRATVFALLLADIFPDKRDGILMKGRESGWLRVIGGVHYPTDVFAGRVLGQAIVRELKASPAFQADFEAAKAEAVAAKTELAGAGAKK